MKKIFFQKITDFGAAVLATVTDQRSGNQPDNDIRTAPYCAPEFFRARLDGNNELRTSKYDVYRSVLLRFSC